MTEVLEVTGIDPSGIVIDPAEVEKGVFDAFADAGYVTGEGDEQERSMAALTDAAYAAIRKAVVSEKGERSRNALTKGGLCSKLFPNVPGAEPGTTDVLDNLQRAVWNELVRIVWSLTNPNVTGAVQKLLTARDPSFILVRTKITPAHAWEWGVYVTEDVDLILSDFCLPLKEKVRLVSETLAKNLAMVSERKPEMKATLTKELDSGMKAATNLAKSTLALTTGSSD